MKLKLTILLNSTDEEGGAICRKNYYKKIKKNSTKIN